MERLEPLNILAFIHDELLLFDDHNHSTPSGITNFSLHISKEYCEQLFSSSVSLLITFSIS